MCVHIFTAFEVSVLKLFLSNLVSALKSNMAAISMETNRMEKIILIFSLHIFILFIINIQWNEWVEKWAKQFLDQHPHNQLSC